MSGIRASVICAGSYPEIDETTDTAITVLVKQVIQRTFMNDIADPEGAQQTL